MPYCFLKGFIWCFNVLFQCNAAVGVKAFFDMMHGGPHKVMLFGAACTQVTDPIAKASRRWHLTQVSISTSVLSCYSTLISVEINIFEASIIRHWHGPFFHNQPHDWSYFPLRPNAAPILQIFMKHYSSWKLETINSTTVRLLSSGTVL